jgi:hypothetical protein
VTFRNLPDREPGPLGSLPEPWDVMAGRVAAVGGCGGSRRLEAIGGSW